MRNFSVSRDRICDACVLGSCVFSSEEWVCAVWWRRRERVFRVEDCEVRRRFRAERRVLSEEEMREMLDRSDEVWKLAVVWRISWGEFVSF